MTKEIPVVAYVPDYEHECMNCGESPVVTGIDKDGKAIFGSDMCGPCTWGEASALDPSTW